MDMPTVFISGLHPEITQDELRQLFYKLRAVFTKIKGLGFYFGLRADSIIFWYLPDLWRVDLGNEITIFVDGMKKQLGRTEKVRKCLETSLAGEVSRFFPKARVVKCQVSPFGKGGTVIEK